MDSAHRLGMVIDADALEESKKEYFKTISDKTTILKLLVVRKDSCGEITDSSETELRWSKRALVKRSINKLGVIENALAPLPKMAGIKHTNRLPYVLAGHEMLQNGWDEAVLCSTAGSVIESLHYNLWCFIDNQWFTPDLKECGVAGVARECILKASVETKVATIPIEELLSIRSLALSNSVHGIVIPNFLNGQRLDTKPAEELQSVWGKIMGVEQ